VPLQATGQDDIRAVLVQVTFIRYERFEGAASPRSFDYAQDDEFERRAFGMGGHLPKLTFLDPFGKPRG
jgi:hypothetical protein